jgi:hypothetical protein
MVAIFFIFVMAGMLPWLLEAPDVLMSRIAGYYQTDNRHQIASYVALSLFRRVYSDSRLYVHYDATRPTKPIAADLITYSNQSEQSTKSNGMYFSTSVAAMAYVQRLQRAAAMAPWVLLLEDDVWVYRGMETRELRFDVSGTCWATYRREYAAILNKSCYGAYGGHYLNGSRLLTLSNDAVSILIDKLLAAHSPIASDELLSAIVIQHGGTIGYYEGYREFSGPFWLNGNGWIKTVHQAKWLYFLG